MSEEKGKTYTLRIPVALYDRIQQIADADLRSVNAMMLVLLMEGVRRREAGRRAENDALEESIEALGMMAA